MEHEKAILAYSASTDRKEREVLYRSMIGPVFNEMVDKIVYTYKFNNLPNIEELKDECKMWITTILDKFDETKGSKAFSYFSVITKNWFIHKVKKINRQNKKEVCLDDDENSKDIDHDSLHVHTAYEEDRENSEFWKHLWTEIDMWKQLDLKSNEKKVLEAIVILLENPESIEIFNKKAVYLYIREITNLNTKQVVSSLTKLRQKYKTFRKEWNNAEF